MNCCPQCGSTKSWHFDKVEPDEGNCWKCGFGYVEHIGHPLEEQIKDFRKKRSILRALRKKKLIKND